MQVSIYFFSIIRISLVIGSRRSCSVPMFKCILHRWSSVDKPYTKHNTICFRSILLFLYRIINEINFLNRKKKKRRKEKLNRCILRDEKKSEKE